MRSSAPARGEESDERSHPLRSHPLKRARHGFRPPVGISLRRGRIGRGPAGRLERHPHLPRLRPRDARHHLLGGAAHPHDEGLLCRGRRSDRLPEWSGDRRRLYVGGFVPRHLGARLHLRLLWAHLFDRLPGRLAVHHVPDGRTLAQPRPLHLRRRRLLSPSGDADARDGGDWNAGRRRALSDRADGRRGATDRALVRPALPLGGRRGRRADGHLRHLRRHDRHHLGADHQGGAPVVRIDGDGAAGARPVRVRLQRADRQGGRGPSGPREDPDARRRSRQSDQRVLARASR